MTTVRRGFVSLTALLLLLLSVGGTRAAAVSKDPVAAADEDLMKASPLTVARCRAGCLHELVSRDEEATECEKKSDCWKCWKYCEVLQTEGKNMKNICEHNCDAGCREACSFHDWHGGSQPSPVVEARGERALTIESGTLRWPRPADDGPSAPRLVYVIMRRREPGTRRTWSQLGQTPGYKARLPKTTAPCTVRVLAVSAEGLVTIYSPAPTPAAAPADVNGRTADGAAATPPAPSSPTSVADTLRDADVIIRSLGRDQILGIRLPLASRSAPQEESLRLMGNDPSDPSQVWNLREVSMIHQKVLVIAEVAWDARQVHRPAYLVTWEIDGGGLKGNLFTDTTCVTLSLWPDTAYLIQVSLLGGADESVKMSTSPTLLLDTTSAIHSTATGAEATRSTAATVAGWTGAAADFAAAAAPEVKRADGSAVRTAEVAEDASDDQPEVARTAAAEVPVAAQDVVVEAAPVEKQKFISYTWCFEGVSYEWMLFLKFVSVLLVLAVVLLLHSCMTKSGEQVVHKVRKCDAECPSLLDCAPLSQDFVKYLDRCRKPHQLLDEYIASHPELQVMHVRR